MLALLNWRLWAALLLAVGLAASHWKAYKVGQNEGVAQLNEFKLEQSQQSLKLLEQRDATTASLADAADQTRKAKNVQIAKLNTDLSDALERLRNRPERPREGDLPSDPAAGAEPSCTGAGLFRPDAEFLIRFATATRKLQLDLGECQAAYGRAQDALK